MEQKYRVWEIKNTQVKCKYVWTWSPQLWVWFAHAWLTVFLANMSKQTLNCHNVLFENTKRCWVNKSKWHRLFLTDRSQLKWWERWCCTSSGAEWSNSFLSFKEILYSQRICYGNWTLKCKEQHGWVQQRTELDVVHRNLPDLHVFFTWTLQAEDFILKNQTGDPYLR